MCEPAAVIGLKRQAVILEAANCYGHVVPASCWPPERVALSGFSKVAGVETSIVARPE